MKLYPIIFCLISGLVNAQIVNIPDANFKFHLVNKPCVDTNLDQIPEFDADLNNDGEIQVSEAEAILGGLIVPWSFMDPAEEKIDDLTGIESFVNIRLLSIFGNDIAGELDLSSNIELETLYASDNRLTSLILGNNPNLTVAYCGSNLLTNIDTSGAEALTNLGAGLNRLPSLDLSNNLELVDVRVFGNLMTEFTLPSTNTLTTLYVSRNRLEEIDLTPAINLTDFYGANNRFTEFDPGLSPQLETISLGDNDFLTSVDFSQNINLVDLYIKGCSALRTFNMQNGNNVNMANMVATLNPSLECVVVDDINGTNVTCVGINGVHGWCLDSTVTITETECVLSVEEFDLSNFILYPNPIRDELNIKTDGEFEAISIYSIQGVLIKEAITKVVDLSNLSAGVYFVKITVDGVIETKRIVKE